MVLFSSFTLRDHTRTPTHMDVILCRTRTKKTTLLKYDGSTEFTSRRQTMTLFHHMLQIYLAIQMQELQLMTHGIWNLATPFVVFAYSS